MVNTNKLLKLSDIDFKTDFLHDYAEHIEFKDLSELYQYLDGNDHNYIQDQISESADSSVDIYYYDLRKWAVDNYQYIEEAIDEMGAPVPFDFHKAIQYGQYKYYSEAIYEDVNKFKKYLENNYNF